MGGFYTEILESWEKEKTHFEQIKKELSLCGYTDEEKNQIRVKLASEFVRPEEINWMSYPKYFLLNTGLGKKDWYHDLSTNLWKVWNDGEIVDKEGRKIFVEVLNLCINEISPMLYEYFESLQRLKDTVSHTLNDETDIEIKSLYVGTTFAVLELMGDDIYETDEYEIWIDGKLRSHDNKMVVSVYNLHPDRIYCIELKGKNLLRKIIVKTGTETVKINVRDFGAKGDGNNDDTMAIQSAVLSCPMNGRVFIPEGTYMFYQLFLKSDITIELAKGAILKSFSTEENRPVLPGSIEREDVTGNIYDLASWEGNPLDCYASIITGIEVNNVVICGQGTIDGGGDFTTWWINEKKYPVMNQKKTYRPKMCFLNRCENVIIQGVTFANSPCWNMHPYFSKDIRFLGITLKSPAGSHNTDGIDPESCENVDITGVHFSVGDDCIAIKSGKIYMGKLRKIPSSNINIHQCFMERGHGAVTVGSEIAGGVKDVYVTSCRFLQTDRGLRVKTRRGRGRDSVIDNIVFDNIIMEKVKAAFVVNEFYYCDPDGKSEYVSSKVPLPVDERTPEIKNIVIRNVKCTDTAWAGVYMYGLPEKKIEYVEISNVSITFDNNAKAGIPAMMVGCEPVKGLGVFMENIERKKLVNVDIKTD